MELQDRIVHHFHTSLDLKAQTIEEYTPVIAEASELMFHCLLSENKILCCGNGGSAAVAQAFCSLLLNRYTQERPGLPAMALNADNATLTAIAEDGSFSDIYAKQIRALGQPGDVLLVITAAGRSPSMVQAIQAAHDREMTVIALTGHDGGDVTALLQPEEPEICVPSDEPPLVHETHFLIVNCLCNLIDYQLFGGDEL